MSHPNGPQPPYPPHGQPPQGQPPYGPPAQGQPPYGPPQPGPYGPPQGPPQGQPPYGQQPPPQWQPPQGGPQQPGPYGLPPQGQPPYGQQPPQWGPPPAPGPDGDGGGGGGRNLALVIGGIVVVVALVVAAVFVGIQAFGGSDEGEESGGSDRSSESKGDDSSKDDDSDEADAPGGAISATTVTALRETLDAEDAWTCYESVPDTLVRCHYFVAGDDPQRATLRVDLADGAVINVDFMAALVEDPAPVSKAAATAVGDALLDGKGEDLVAAMDEDAALDADTLDVQVRFTAYGDGFQLTAEGAEVPPPDPASPPDTAAMAATLKGGGFTCKKQDDRTVSCDRNDGRTEVRVLGIDNDRSTSWNVSVRGASYDTPLTEAQARATVGQEITKLGLTDEAGATFLSTAADRQTGDFKGFELENGIYSTGDDAYVSVMVGQIH